MFSNVRLVLSLALLCVGYMHTPDTQRLCLALFCFVFKQVTSWDRTDLDHWQLDFSMSILPVTVLNGLTTFIFYILSDPFIANTSSLSYIVIHKDAVISLFRWASWYNCVTETVESSRYKLRILWCSVIKLSYSSLDFYLGRVSPSFFLCKTSVWSAYTRA